MFWGDASSHPASPPVVFGGGAHGRWAGAHCVLVAYSAQTLRVWFSAIECLPTLTWSVPRTWLRMGEGPNAVLEALGCVDKMGPKEWWLWHLAMRIIIF